MSHSVSTDPVSTPPAAPDTPADRWGGGVTPFNMSWQKFMMWVFLISDALIFIGFLAAYGFNRLAEGTWPEQGEVFHLEFVTFMTFVLISSSATMACAVAASQRGDYVNLLRFLKLTYLGGLVFLGCQVVEWCMLLGEGGRLTANPWGIPGFTSFFYVITGFHGTHVLVGLIILLITGARAWNRKWTPEGIELAGLYWHFVDLIWVFIFGLFYLV